MVHFSEEVNLDKSVAEKDCLNEIAETEFYETIIEEGKEDIANDFIIEDEENDLDFQSYEKATLDKTNDPPNDKNADWESDIGSNIDNDEKDIENDSHSEIIDFDDRAENAVDGNLSKKNKRQLNEIVIVSGKKQYPCKTCGQLFSKSGYLSRHKKLHTGEKLTRMQLPEILCRFKQFEGAWKKTHRGKTFSLWCLHKNIYCQGLFVRT